MDSQLKRDVRRALKTLDKVLDELAYRPLEKWDQKALDDLHAKLYKAYNLLDRSYGDVDDGEARKPLDFRGGWHGVVEDDELVGDPDEEEEAAGDSVDRGDGPDV